jgi:replicative DNA helicase
MLMAIDECSALFAPDAERATLGAILGNNEHMAEAIARLQPEHFATERERISMCQACASQRRSLHSVSASARLAIGILAMYN